jgi:transaldolase
MTLSVENLQVKLFADGADLDGMLEMNAKPYIKGLTTNPTLMRKAGITNYKEFATEVLTQITAKPISFEVFSDELDGMKRQALEIASWGENVYVKIPITNTMGVSTSPVIEFLVQEGVKVNVTALMTSAQVLCIASALNPKVPSYVSMFAGRIADTGRNPEPIMVEAINILRNNKAAELIWASPRELFNVFQANTIGCHIITATSDVLKKLELIGKDLDQYSRETVEMFFTDAKASGLDIELNN